MKFNYTNRVSLPKPVSQAIHPSGRPIAKTGSYTHVLVHETQELNKWSNSLPKLQSELDFLVQCGWKREELHIIETKRK